MANRFKVQTTPKAKVKVNRFIVAPQTTKTTTTTPKTTSKAPTLQPGMSTATIEKQNAAAFAKFGVKAPAGAPKMSIPPTLGGPKIGFEFKSKDVWGENYKTPRADFSNESVRQTIAGPKPLKDLFGNAAGQVNHVVPVSLGGTGSTKNTANLDWREDKRSLLQKILKSDISFTKAQQSGRVLVEVANEKDFRDGKITQGQAIANILAWDEANGQGKANQLKRTNPALASQIMTQAGQINNKFFPDSEDVSLAKLADQNPVKIAFSIFGDKIKKGIEAVGKGVSAINQKNIEKLNKGGDVAKYGLDGLKNFVTNGLAKAGSDLGYLFWDEMDKPVKSKSIVSEKTRSKLPPAFQQVTDKITDPSDLGGNLSNLQKQTVGKLFKNTDFDQRAATGFKDLSNYFEKKSAEKYVGLGLNEMKATDPRKIAWNVGQGGGSMALAVGTSVLTANPTIGVALLTAVDTSGEYKAARDAGKTREEALNTFLTSTAGTFISEKVGMDMFFKTMGGPLVVRALKHAIAETAQEESQQWWQNLVAKKGYDESRKVTDGMLDVLLSTPFIGMWGAGLDNNPTIKALNDQQLKMVQEKTGLSETDAKGFLDSAVKVNNQQQLELAQNLAGIMKAGGKILSDALNSEEGFARIPGEQTKVVDNLQLAEKGVDRVLNDFATKVDYRISGEFNKTTEIGDKIRSIELGEIDSPGKLYSALKEEVSKLDIAPDVKTKITASLKESVGDYFTMLKGGETSTLGYEKVLETTKGQEGFAKIPEIKIPQDTSLNIVSPKENLKGTFEKATEIVEGVKGKTVKLSTYLNEKAFSEKIKARRERLEAIRDYLQLSDDDVRRISRKDIRFMNDYEFEQFLKNFDSMAIKYAETKQAKLELLALINDREFKNWDNLRQANGFKKIDEMSVAELRAFEKALVPYQFGDEFLSIRKLETIDNTDLVGLKTLREVKQRLAEDIGISVENFDRIEVSFLDKFKGDTTLARKNAFFNFMVDEYNKSKLQNDYDYLEFEKQLDELGRAAEKSVGLTLGEKIVPQQKIVMAYLETTEANRLILAEKMTKEEIDLAVFLQNEYQKALAYLIQQKALFSSRFDGNYFVHIRRGILEEIKEDGIVSAVKNIFSQYKENEQNFKILDDDTQNILPLEKFFKFSLFRSGGIKPTQNVIEASKAYFRMLYTKKALDSMIPKVDIYAQVLTPKEMTPHGLEMDRSLKKFVNEWVNNKKGRKTSFGGVITQGGPADIALRTTKMFTSLLDLGLNLPVSIATYIGEATAQFPLLGAKNYSLGIFRKQTNKGKRILAKYQNFTGRSAWDSLIAPGQGLFDRFLNGIFIGFRDSSHRANTFYLLGSMTRQEFMSEKISDERLSELRKNLGKYRIVEGAKSIIGSTSFGSAATQYKSWAIPIFSTTINNFKNVIANKSLRKESATELVRTLEILAIPLIIGAMLADKDDDKGFINKLKQRALTEAMSLYGALNLKSLLATPRVYTLLQDFVGNLGLLIKLEEFKTGANAGDLKGAQGLKKQFTPRAIKQITENIETGKKWQIILDRSKNEPIDDETKATFKEELKAYYEEELDKIEKSKEEVEFKTEELDKTIKNKITQFKNNQFDLAAEKAFKKLKGLDPAERESFFNTLPKSVQTRIETIIKNEKKKQLNN